MMATQIPIETVTTDSFTMDYFKFGRGERTLVVLPGLSVQSVMGLADAVAEAYRVLTDDFTIYLFDRRKQLPATYSVGDMAHDTAAAFRALGLSQVCVLGVSLGGMVAMTMAIEQPDLVQKLVLCCTAACETDTLRSTASQWVELAKAGDAAGLYLAFGEALYPSEAFEQSRDLLVEAAQTVTSDELDYFATLAEGIKGFDIIDQLDQISCPVFLVGSHDDCVLGPDAASQIAKRLNDRPDFEIHMYDGYGHAAYDTAPDFKDRVLRFLTQ